MGEMAVVLISQGVILIGYILTFITQRRKDRNEHDRRLEEIRDDFAKQTNEIHISIRDMQSAYEQMMKIFEVKLDTLSERVERHNKVVERTYELEKAVEVLKNRNAVSEHRLADLESGR